MRPELFLAIMLFPFLALAAMLVKWRALPNWWQLLLRVAFLSLLALILFNEYPPGWATDHPIPPGFQLPVLLTCIAAVLFVRPLPMALTAGALFFAIAFFEWNMFQSIFDRPGTTWRGLPMRVSFYARDTRSEIVDGMAAMHEGESHAPGYADEIDPQVVADATMVTRLREFRLIRSWYSGILDVESYESRPARMWFCGGRLDQGEKAFKIVGSGDFRPGLNPPNLKTTN